MHSPMSFRIFSSSSSSLLLLFLSSSLLFLVLCPFSTLALLQDEAGLNDFLVATAGHGVGTHVVVPSTTTTTSSSIVISTGTASPCWVSSRSTAADENGALQWRRHVCEDHPPAPSSKTPQSPKLQTAVIGLDSLVTVHGTTVRGWTLQDGVLVWEHVAMTDTTTTTTTTSSSTTTMTTLSDLSWVALQDAHTNELTIRHAASGRVVVSMPSNEFSTRGAPESLLQLVRTNTTSTKADDDTTMVWAVVGTMDATKDGVVQGSSVRVMELLVTDPDTGGDSGGAVRVGTSTKVGGGGKLGDFWASSLVVLQGHNNNNDCYGVALSSDKRQVVSFSLGSSVPTMTAGLAQFHPLWTSMERMETTLEPGVVRIHGLDDRYVPPRKSMALFRFEPLDQQWDQWYEGDEETQFDAIGYCPDSRLVVALSHDSHQFEAIAVGNVAGLETAGERLTRTQRHLRMSPLQGITVVGDESDIPETDRVTDFTVLSCETDSLSALLTTERGTTSQWSFTKTSADQVTVKMDWSQEEGLAHVSSAVLLDASHHSIPVLDTISEEEQLATLLNLTFLSRLELQVKTLLSKLLRTGTPTSRSHDFGFVKVAVLVSSSAHRVWGMPTSGAERGSISWSLDLPADAEWHTLVHGTSSSTAGIAGLSAGTHSPEVLLLSSVPKDDGTVEIAWTCVEGTTGIVHASGSSPSPLPVVQVIPVHGGGTCTQGALLLHEDKSLSIIPHNDHKTLSAIAEHVRSHRNGMYTHVVNRENASLESFQIVEASAALSTQSVGRTAFPGETIVAVSYPQREEVVQSPSTVLGDDSLLLKYLNPHLVVLVTMSDNVETTDFAAALAKKNSRKPKGVTQPGDSASMDNAAQTEDAPNLFVNIMDTVSGRVLYRASHSNAQGGQDVQVVISENWVIYAFVNQKTRRTELGVLTLYEGMIDKNGLTAFKSPEQTMSFSSLEAGDAKPVVLSKTYGLPKSITALGVTLTRGGISTRQVLFATGDDKITALTRQVLEPRRPTGEVKESEKIEGLYKYHPLLNFISQWSPSYNQTVHGATKILSAPAALESQSLVLVVGGPDIFFTRLSPSKGFDLLPDDFSRILLVLIVVGILLVLMVVRGMSKKKIVTTGWA